MKRALLRFCLTLGLLGAAHSAAAVTSGDPGDVAAIRAIGERWQKLYSAGRYSDIPELYTKDALIMPRGRPVVEGREGMRRAVGGLAAGRKVEIDIDEREIVVSGDHAWMIGDFEVSYTPRDGGTPTVERGRSLILFRRDRDGTWRIHRDMDSPAPVQTATAQASTLPASPTAQQSARAWDGSDRTVATQCDRLASSRYVRQRLAAPVAREDIDVPAAIAQCEADLARLPGDPRIHFHLGRLYSYAGNAGKALYHRREAAKAGNHNAIFLLAYLDYTSAADDNVRCRAAAEMKRAADLGNYSAQLTFAAFYLDARLPGCADLATDKEVASYVAAAKPAADGFFENLLATHLERGIAQRTGTAE